MGQLEPKTKQKQEPENKRKRVAKTKQNKTEVNPESRNTAGLWASLVAQVVNYLSATQGTWVRSLGWEDVLEKERATHFGILAWRIPQREEPGGL